MKKHLVTIVILGGVVMISAVGVVLSKHYSRKLFVELQALETKRDELTVEWGRLQLEQSTWATHGRIEKLARERLGMDVPTPDSTIIVQQ
jgi:cell division protein FtsL